MDGGQVKVTLCCECGKAFEARRSDARFCSEKCKKRAKRRRDRARVRTAVLKSDPLPQIEPETYDDVADALDDARRVSNRFGQLAFSAPSPVRPGCSRISEAITGAIEREGW